ncbi:hypothetical protein SAMN04487895_103401 [Paenibacillus sophorae]|uniref:ATP-grasp domain-containing protein n=1 Tax=Paenibacillus sophorae TaxID=1333845 RepID=A0A1H8KEC4_9BACL|nr:hypothetical protein [Paenibacillus sophorae]QWU13712.1 hypothetical protein KP014_17165 [Paenibacillus sophorae]SEN91021.1 hypothetical protein SAMN04487895_103401 [Paenibacillus sophorae]
MARELVAGIFDAESHWRDENLARLPAIRDKERERIVLAMDELMFPFCGSGDTLLTRFAMEDAHKAYLASIGFSFGHLVWEGEEASANLFQAMVSDSNYDERYRAFDALSPFSIVPYTREVIAKYGYDTKVPGIETVKRVNSKIYSTLLTGNLLGTSFGKPVYSAEELSVLGHNLLAEHGSVLIKDPYGVSGKGNMLLQSQASLERVASYIRRQEGQGKAAAFVIEPYLDVECDFSCQFDILRDGSFQLTGLQKILNRQFAYLGSESMDADGREALERAGYFEVLMQAAASLYKDGYYGPVCIDSMILKDGTLVPIVEINARKSMGFINHRLDQVLETCGKKGFFTFRSVGFKERFDYEWWLDELKRHDILYPNRQGNGILPLSSATLFAGAAEAGTAAPEGGGLYKGRLYMTVIADHMPERERYLERMRLSFESKGGKWYS